MSDYPRIEGDVIVIGPECFAALDKSVICWQGENYYPAASPGRAADTGSKGGQR